MKGTPDDQIAQLLVSFVLARPGLHKLGDSSKYMRFNPLNTNMLIIFSTDGFA